MTYFLVTVNIIILLFIVYYIVSTYDLLTPKEYGEPEPTEYGWVLIISVVLYTLGSATIIPICVSLAYLLGNFVVKSALKKKKQNTPE